MAGGEEFRILWMGLIPLYNNNLLAKIEAVMPVRFVWEEMWMFDHPDCPPVEPADDLRGLFYSQMADRLCGSVFYDPTVRCRKLTALATRMKVDLVIDALQRHCSFFTALGTLVPFRFGKKRESPSGPYRPIWSGGRAINLLRTSVSP